MIVVTSRFKLVTSPATFVNCCLILRISSDVTASAGACRLRGGVAGSEAGVSGASWFADVSADPGAERRDRGGLEMRRCSFVGDLLERGESHLSPSLTLSPLQCSDVTREDVNKSEENNTIIE